ncbi:MAG: diacylglycerol/lipid kinase family protein, partial [Erysipelotrichaceae bacterium]
MFNKQKNKRHIFIVNPISGRNKNDKVVPLISKLAKKHHLDYQIVYSRYHKHAIELAREHSKNKHNIIYACGGDGTVNEVLNGLNLKCSMAVIPCGSGNDFYYSLDQKKIDLASIIEETMLGEPVVIDYGSANSHRFLNITNLGFDAKINYLASEKYRYHHLIPLKLIYIFAALKCAFKPELIKLNINIDKLKIKKDSLLMVVANGKRYGGGFKATPQATLNDGYL